MLLHFCEIISFKVFYILQDGMECTLLMYSLHNGLKKIRTSKTTHRWWFPESIHGVGKCSCFHDGDSNHIASAIVPTRRSLASPRRHRDTYTTRHLPFSLPSLPSPLSFPSRVWRRRRPTGRENCNLKRQPRTICLDICNVALLRTPVSS